MQKISSKTLKNIGTILMSAYVTYCIVIVIWYELSFLMFIAFILSGAGFVTLLAVIFKMLTKLNNLRVRKEQQWIDENIKLARKEGKKSIDLPKNNPKHTIWAKNWLEARNIYNLYVLPQTLKHPKKTYYYVSSSCNNLKNK